MARTLLYTHNLALRHALRRELYEHTTDDDTDSLIIGGPDRGLYGNRFDTIIILDAPRNDLDRETIDTAVRCRLEPDGTWIEL